jgi:hypothetical protein
LTRNGLRHLNKYLKSKVVFALDIICKSNRVELLLISSRQIVKAFSGYAAISPDVLACYPFAAVSG